MISRFLVIAFFAWAVTAFPVHAAPATGSAPNLVARTLDGQEIDLHALHGKNVIVHFWASWCPACHEEMILLDSFYRHAAPGSIAIVAINTEQPHMRDKTKKIMQAFSYKAVMKDDIITSDFGIPQMLPMTYIMDKHGVLQYQSDSDHPLTEETLQKVIHAP